MGGKSTKNYVTSPRMLEKNNKKYEDQIFDHKLERIIEQITEFVKNQQIVQKLQIYLMEKIVQWFQDIDKPKKYQKVKIEFLDKFQRKKVKKRFNFTQLNKKEHLAELFKKFQQQYWMQIELQKIVDEFPKKLKQRKLFYTKNSIRKDQKTFRLNLQKQQQKILIYEKIVAYFYLRILSKQLSLNNESINNLLIQFHMKMGLKIIRFIEKKRLSIQELLYIIYHLLLIFSSRLKEEKQKLGLIQENLNEIEKYFLKRFTDEEYICDLQPQQIANIKQVTNCYLNELYNNPYIEQERQTSIKYYLAFPVQTVRLKNQKKY